MPQRTLFFLHAHRFELQFPLQLHIETGQNGPAPVIFLNPVTSLEALVYAMVVRDDGSVLSKSSNLTFLKSTKSINEKVVFKIPDVEYNTNRSLFFLRILQGKIFLEVLVRSTFAILIPTVSPTS